MNIVTASKLYNHVQCNYRSINKIQLLGFIKLIWDKKLRQPTKIGVTNRYDSFVKKKSVNNIIVGQLPICSNTLFWVQNSSDITYDIPNCQQKLDLGFWLILQAKDNNSRFFRFQIQ